MGGKRTFTMRKKYTKNFEDAVIAEYKNNGFNARQVAIKFKKYTTDITRILKRRGEFVVKSGKGSEHSQWKGGRSVHSQSGYWTVYCPNHQRTRNNNRVYEHILIAEKKLGRPIPKEEPIHHIDFDRQNNDPDNLYVCESNKEHMKIHYSLEDIARELFRQGKLGFKDGRYVWL